MTYTRGCNPVISLVDLNGLQLDDTYYWHVLQNTLPYLPANIYQDESGTSRANPVQFLSNGTLPVNLYYDDDITYRIEVRNGPTQSDALIYLIENYIPGTGSGGGIDTVALATDNQITNSQFSLISFEDPYEQLSITNPDPIEVAPGWHLVLEGTGNVKLERLSINNAIDIPTNAPYALKITLSGTWTGTPYLRQRFSQNGIQWSGKYVSTSITARLEGANNNISARLDDSNGNPLVEVMESTEIDQEFEQYTGNGFVPATTNPDLPPDAYIDYKILMPTTVTIYLTSIQVVASDIPAEYSYQQDTIERQQDHTFHYYKDSVIVQPKDSILCGFNFNLNPWQFTSTASTTMATQTAYRSDQVIIHQRTGANNIKHAQAPASRNFALNIEALTADNQFALIEYIDPSTCRPYWGRKLSMLLRAKLNTTNGSTVQFKVRLIRRTTLPSSISGTEPIASWTTEDTPVFAAGWTEIAPKNDPVYTLDGTLQTFAFDGFELDDATTANETLGVVLYTIEPMIESGTPDSIDFHSASLVPNDFAVDSNPLTFNQNLERCEFYYEKSHILSAIPGVTAGPGGALMRQMAHAIIPGSPTPNLINAYSASFSVDFKTRKRTDSPTVVLYGTTGTQTANQVSVFLYHNGGQIGATQVAMSGNWVNAVLGSTGAYYVRINNNVLTGSSVTLTSPNSVSANILFSYSVNARMG